MTVRRRLKLTFRLNDGHEFSLVVVSETMHLAVRGIEEAVRPHVIVRFTIEEI